MTRGIPARQVERVVRSHGQLVEMPLLCKRTSKLWGCGIDRPKLRSYNPANPDREAFRAYARNSMWRRRCLYRCPRRYLSTLM